MVQAEQLKKLGEQASKDFLDNGTPLQKSLEKMAALHKLNSHQAHRVAEQANLSTHLSMLKTASIDDAYITFDVADASKIKSMEKQSEASLDYYNKPDFNVFSLHQEKTASVEPEEAKEPELASSEKYLQSTEKVGSVKKAHNELTQLQWRLSDALDPIYSTVKQAALSGIEPSALEHTIKAASF